MFFVGDLISLEYIIFTAFSHTFLESIAFLPFLKDGLKIYHSSGFTAPCTTFSPKPYAQVSNTASLNHDSVSIENITQLHAKSDLTIFCTEIDKAIEK
jgi:hypothetical protein